MSEKRSYDEVIRILIDEIGNEFLRGVLKVSTKNRKHLADCITDGSLERTAREIIKLEARVRDLESERDGLLATLEGRTP